MVDVAFQDSRQAVLHPQAIGFARRSAQETRPPFAVHQQAAACLDCRLQPICLAAELRGEEWEAPASIVTKRTRIPKREKLYRIGDRFQGFFTIRLGSFKTETVTDGGHGQIIGFHLPGELLGTDGPATNHHECEATALEDSEVCMIATEQLETLGPSLPALDRCLQRLMSREIAHNHREMMLLGTLGAGERLATFLLSLSRRYAERGFSASEFVLRLRRDEIGSLLGLALETVSRLFSRFERAGLIEVEKKNVRLLDRAGLIGLATHLDSL
jgi:CRP/FNR family transcriptional regulator, anaerobic regulatory protein